jgi:hypothetical protein
MTITGIDHADIILIMLIFNVPAMTQITALANKMSVVFLIPSDLAPSTTPVNVPGKAPEV